MNPNDSSLKNASVVLAGGACLVLFLGRFFSPYVGIVPIRGIWMVTQLAIPMLCLWCGMLIRYRIRRPSPWFLVPVGLLAAVILYNLMRYPGIGLGLRSLYTLVFHLFLGLLLPWNHLRENGDRTGAKSAVLCILTALCYAALYLVWMRLGGVMKPENADMEVLLKAVMTQVLPLAGIVPLLSANEFAFSRAGQWLGSRKWFFWLTLPAALYCFFGALTALRLDLWPTFPYDSIWFVRFLIQPVTVYLLVVLWRIIKGLAKSRIAWKEVFKT